MLDLIKHAFGAVADGFGRAVGDIRDRLVSEGFFNRHVPEQRSPDDLGWSLPSEDRAHDDERSLLERLHETNPELFSTDRDMSGRDHNRGIDR